MKSTPQGGYWFGAAVRESDLPQSARHLAHVLGSVAESKTGRLTVSYSTLMRWTGQGRGTVSQNLKTLTDAGFLKVIPPPVWRRKYGASNVYFTLVPPGFPTTGRTRTPSSPSELGGSSHSELGVVLRGAKGSSDSELSTKRTKGAGPSGSASVPPPTDPLVLSGAAVLTCTECQTAVHESQADGDIYWCFWCNADPTETAFVVPDPDPLKHRWAVRRVAQMLADFSDEWDPICAICSKPEDDHDVD